MARPLSKVTKEGALYVRPSEVEAKIDAAIGSPTQELSRRAAVTDNASTEFLQSECLVQLIREARRNGDDERATALIRLLIIRCEQNLLRTIPDGKITNAELVREEILSDFMLMFTEDGTPQHYCDLDYFECRFGRAFRTFRITRVRQALAAEDEMVRLSQVVAEERDEASDDEMLAKLTDLASVNGSQESSVDLGRILKAIEGLPPKHRKAILLCRVLGYDEESEDPTKRTAATICGVTGRTIRNYLQAADQALTKFEE